LKREQASEVGGQKLELGASVSSGRVELGGKSDRAKAVSPLPSFNFFLSVSYLFCCKKGNDSFVIVIFFSLFQKKTMVMCRRLFLWWCCKEEGYNSLLLLQ
jgi:hypothetical protein